MPEQEQEELDIDELEEQLAQRHEQVTAIKQWAVRQAADLRAKAQVADEADDIEDLPIPAEARKLFELSQQLELLYDRIENGDNKNP